MRDRMLGFVWHEMVTGNAIDEQVKSWASQRPEAPAEPPAADEQADDGEEENWDPNDNPEGPPGRTVAPRPVARNIYEDEDEDDDY